MRRTVRTICSLALLLFVSSEARAQHEGHDMSAMDQGSMAGPLGEGDGRHASGTAWLPDETPMRSAMAHRGGWMLMAHGQLFVQFVDTSGTRGDRQFGSANWFMGMARHAFAGGDLTARAMVSADRLTVGLCGYPDIAQTGIKCGDRLRDLQHPHDLFMEIAADYRRALTDGLAIEIYGGPAGEPALGPPAYPHRLSALPNPVAPIGHHWLDITHISFGVVTGAVYGRAWKAEGSAFNGRHGDFERYGFDLAPLNSYSGRVSFLPSPRWAIQISSGRLRRPEAHNHDPNATDITSFRTTASASYHRVALEGGERGQRVWATTVAWGEQRERGITTGAVLGETAYDISPADTLFGRAELVQRTSEDVIIGALEIERYVTGKVQAGYMRTLGAFRGFEAGIGGAAAIGLIPASLEFVYGSRTPAEVSVFFSLRPTRQPGQ